jgi:hypothetical protein
VTSRWLRRCRGSSLANADRIAQSGHEGRGRSACRRNTATSCRTIRQAAYDLRKLRGKNLIAKPGRSRRYHVLSQPARTITALLTLREQVISPILAGIRSPRMGRKPTYWNRVDRDYETLRINMQTLFHDLGLTTTTGADAA